MQDVSAPRPRTLNGPPPAGEPRDGVRSSLAAEKEGPMARFSFRPPLTLRGRKFMGLRGFSGKPFHPPLTDVPVGAYVLAAAFDVLSWVGGSGHGWTREFYRSGTFVLIGGAIVSLGAALTGFMDWLRST